MIFPGTLPCALEAFMQHHPACASCPPGTCSPLMLLHTATTLLHTHLGERPNIIVTPHHRNEPPPPQASKLSYQAIYLFCLVSIDPSGLAFHDPLSLVLPVRPLHSLVLYLSVSHSLPLSLLDGVPPSGKYPCCHRQNSLADIHVAVLWPITWSFCTLSKRARLTTTVHQRLQLHCDVCSTVGLLLRT